MYACSGMVLPAPSYDVVSLGPRLVVVDCVRCLLQSRMCSLISLSKGGDASSKGCAQRRIATQCLPVTIHIGRFVYFVCRPSRFLAYVWRRTHHQSRLSALVYIRKASLDQRWMVSAQGRRPLLCPCPSAPSNARTLSVFPAMRHQGLVDGAPIGAGVDAGAFRRLGGHDDLRGGDQCRQEQQAQVLRQASGSPRRSCGRSSGGT